MQTDPFGQELRRRRRARDLTQEQLAGLVGCATDMIRKIEAGRRRPSRQVAALLAERLGVPEAERERWVELARTSAEPAPAAPNARSAPPHPVTPLLGRERELAEVATLLAQPDARLVAIVGPGGVGKTRLALEVAHAEKGEAGACWVPLEALTDAAQVLPAIARALGLREGGRQPLDEKLAEALRDTPPLLALDNCEHLLAAAPQIAALLGACPRLHVLATSRAALRVRGEHVFTLAPLALPAPNEGAANAAVALFVQRAMAAQPRFRLGAGNAGAVAALCARLNGLPLAIELAAARVRLLPPAAQLAQLDDGGALALLDNGARDLPERQQSLRNVLAWSVGLLAPPAQRTFRLLAVCSGGCTLALAAALVGQEAPPLQSLDELLAAHLIEQTGDDDEPRFAMLETVRSFAREQLEVSGEAAGASSRHAAFALALAERAAGEMYSPEQPAILAQFDRERANLAGALRWLVGQGDAQGALRLCVAQGRFWTLRSYYSDAEAQIHAALQLAPPDAPLELLGLRGRALNVLAVLARHRVAYADSEQLALEGLSAARRAEHRESMADLQQTLGAALMYQARYAEAAQSYTQALALYQEEGYTRGIALVENDLGEVERRQNHLDAASDHFATSVRMARSLNDMRLLSIVLNNQAITAGMQGNYDAAKTLLEECLALDKQLGDVRSAAIAHANLGEVAHERGDTAGSLRHWREALALIDPAAHREIVLGIAELCAQVLAAANRTREAARLLGLVSAQRSESGVPPTASDIAQHDANVSRVRQATGEGVFDAAFAEGQRGSWRDLLAAVRDIVGAA